MRKFFEIQIVRVTLWLLAIVAGLAVILFFFIQLANGLGWSISLFGWSIPKELIDKWSNFSFWLCVALWVWIVLGEKIKGYWASRPKPSDVWSDSLFLMGKHKFITALVAFVLIATTLDFAFFGR